MSILLVIGALGCLAASAWIVATDLIVGGPQRAAARRLQLYGSRPAATAGGRPAPARRRDLASPLAAIVLRIAPGRDRDQTAAQLQAAGMSKTRVETFLAAKAALAAGGAVGGLFLGSLAGRTTTALLLAVAGAGAGFIAPDIMVSRRGRARREQILRELPNALDLLAVIVEAGLGLDAALARYANRADGPLAEEIGLLGAELRVGASRADVFRRFAERTPAMETQTFVRAITAADKLGVSLSRTLRTQASDARKRRQLVAEQAANKAPIKMLFPTVLCIFPVLFVVVLAPAVLKLVAS